MDSKLQAKDVQPGMRFRALGSGFMSREVVEVVPTIFQRGAIHAAPTALRVTGPRLLPLLFCRLAAPTVLLEL